ncbi:MAG: hypothetical protein ACPG4X_18585 [Pikeienuella sp.]
MIGVGVGATFGTAAAAAVGSVVAEPVNNVALLGFVHSLFDHNDGALGNHDDLAVGTWLRRMAVHEGKTYSQVTDFSQHHAYELPFTGPISGGPMDTITGTSWAGIDAGDVTHMLFTPDNFNRGDDAPTDIPNNFDATASNVGNIIEMVDDYITNVGETPKIRIYNSFPKCPTLDAAGLVTFKADAFSNYRSWGHQIVADIKSLRPSWDVALLDTGEVFADVMDNTAASSLTATDWFEDISPHGWDNTYFIVAAIMYRMLYGSVPTDYTVPAAIHNDIENNWAAIAGYINTRVNTMNASPYPGPIGHTTAANEGAKVTTASNGYGIDVELKSIGFPVEATSIEYTNDGGSNWATVGAAAVGTINLPLESDGTPWSASSTETVRLRAVNAQGNGTQSAPFSVTTGVNVAPTNTVAPSISGGGYIGVEQTCDPGTWTGTAPITFAYQRRLDGVDVEGADTATYTPVSGEAGEELTWAVTATNGVSVTTETAGVTIAAAPSLVTMDGSQSVHGFTSETSCTSFTVLFSGVTIAANPSSHEYIMGINDGTDDIYVSIRSNGRVASTVVQDSGFAQSAFAETVPLNTPFDLLVEFDTAGGIEDTYTFAVYVDGVRWIEYSSSTASQDVSTFYLFADQTNANRVSCTCEGVDVIVNGSEVLDLSPATAALLNSDSDNDSRAFTHTGTFT